MSKKEFKVKLIFPVTSLTWHETSNTLRLMEWHKALLRAGPDGFDRDQRAGKLVLRGRRLTRSPPLFQCMAWQPAFRWWGPNKAWHGVTPVHACWQPPLPAPPETTPQQPHDPRYNHLPAWAISCSPFITEACMSLCIGHSFGYYHGRWLLVSDGLNDSIYLIKYSSGRGMLGMGLVSKTGGGVCVSAGLLWWKKTLPCKKVNIDFIPENHR